MTIKEQIRILDDKIKQNQADHDLYRQNAKISALSSGKLDKYEYLTGEDLGYRPDNNLLNNLLWVKCLIKV